MRPPVLNVQSGRRLGASALERIVSLLAAVRPASWRYIGQSAEPLAAAGAGEASTPWIASPKTSAKTLAYLNAADGRFTVFASMFRDPQPARLN
jgi:hypothetical protein